MQAHAEGLAVRTATIIEEGDAAGHIVYARAMLVRESHIAMVTAERRARVALAGEIAQKRHEPRSVRRHQASADRAVAVALALAVSGSSREAEARVVLWTIQAEQMLDRHWSVVKAVAVALLESGTLDAGRLAELLKPVPFPRRRTRVTRQGATMGPTEFRQPGLSRRESNEA